MWQGAEGIELGVCGLTRTKKSFVHKLRVDSFYIESAGAWGKWKFAAQTEYGVVSGQLKWEQGENEWVPYQLDFNGETKRVEAALYFSEDKPCEIEQRDEMFRDLDIERMTIEVTLTMGMAAPNPIQAYNSMASQARLAS